MVNVTSNEGLCGQVPDGVAGLLDHNTTNLNTHCAWTDDGEIWLPKYGCTCLSTDGMLPDTAQKARATAEIAGCCAGCQPTEVTVIGSAPLIGSSIAV